MIIRIDELKSICYSILKCAGIMTQDADYVISHLLEEELLGKSSHGFFRLPSIISIAEKMDTSRRAIEIRDMNQFGVKVNATNTLGLVATHLACEVCINKVHENGVSIVGLSGYRGTTGALGYYARMFAKHNQIAIISCTSEYAVAPWGGKEAILGTNPIAISIPYENSPIIVDFSTAAMTYGDLMLAAKEDRKIPSGIVLDKDGNPSTDPNDANNGCQLPMAGHKGYALGLAIEVLAGLFIGAKAGKDAVEGSDGVFMIAFQPDMFVAQETYLTNLAKLSNEILSSQPAVGSKGIRLPGENCFALIDNKLNEGICEIADVVYNDIMELARRCGK